MSSNLFPVNGVTKHKYETVEEALEDLELAEAAIASIRDLIESEDWETAHDGVNEVMSHLSGVRTLVQEKGSK